MRWPFLFIYTISCYYTLMKFSAIKYWTIVFILVIIVIGIYLVFSKILEAFVIGRIVEAEVLSNI